MPETKYKLIDLSLRNARLSFTTLFVNAAQTKVPGIAGVFFVAVNTGPDAQISSVEIDEVIGDHRLVINSLIYDALKDRWLFAQNYMGRLDRGFMPPDVYKAIACRFIRAAEEKGYISVDGRASREGIDAHERNANYESRSIAPFQSGLFIYTNSQID